MTQTQTTQSLQQHLDRLRQGDGSARDALIGSACERLRVLSRRMLRDYPGVRRWEETDDVMNNAVVRLCRALADVRPATVRDFLGLATLQIRRELIDLARRYHGPEGLGANYQSYAAGGPEGSTPAAPHAPDSTYSPDRLSAWTEFHTKVDSLPAEDREVFDLLWFQELGQAEASALLGVSESTVKRRWQSARRRLHDLLGGQLPF